MSTILDQLNRMHDELRDAGYLAGDAAWAGDLPDFTVALPGQPPAAARGKWRVVEANDLLTDRDPGHLLGADLPPPISPGGPLPGPLEPARLGDSATSDRGAPIVNRTGDVLSGNHRTEALRTAYATGRGADYRRWLTAQAGGWGVPATHLAAMKAPLLVREATDLGGLGEAEFVRRSNPHAAAVPPAPRAATRDALGLDLLAAGVRQAAPDLAALRGTGYDLEPALKQILADQQRPTPSPYNADREFLRRTLAEADTPEAIAGMLRRYGQLVGNVFPDVDPRELLTQAAAAERSAAQATLAKVDARGQPETDRPGGAAGARPIVSMAGRLLRHIRDLPEDDLKRVFLQTQHDILLKLAKEDSGIEDKKWLDQVVTRFMTPMFDALDGRPDKGWRRTLDRLGKIQWYRNYAGIYPDAVSQYHRRALEIYAAREMALNHILQDLRAALETAGNGSDADWRAVGKIVNDAQKKFFSLDERLASELTGIFISPTMDVEKIRNAMRSEVEASSTSKGK